MTSNRVDNAFDLQNLPGGCHGRSAEGAPWPGEKLRRGGHRACAFVLSPWARAAREPGLASGCRRPGSPLEGLVFFGRRVLSACVPGSSVAPGRYHHRVPPPSSNAWSQLPGPSGNIILRHGPCRLSELSTVPAAKCCLIKLLNS